MTTGLIRWNPETDLLRGRFDRVFNEMLNDLWNPAGRTEDVASRSWLPAVGKVIRHNAVCQRLTVRLEDGTEIETPLGSIQPPTG